MVHSVLFFSFFFTFWGSLRSVVFAEGRSLAVSSKLGIRARSSSTVVAYFGLSI